MTCGVTSLALLLGGGLIVGLFPGLSALIVLGGILLLPLVGLLFIGSNSASIYQLF